MAFLGDAMSHGLLPGVALAALLGGNLLVGAVAERRRHDGRRHRLGRTPRLSQDTGIGLLFVGMLSLGVIIVSRSQSFAVDLTGFLFGDVLAVRNRTSSCSRCGVARDPGGLGPRSPRLPGPGVRRAQGTDPGSAPPPGPRPAARAAGLAIVASFHIVGTLLVLGLLIAPPAAALPWARSVRGVMALAALLGMTATFCGLLLSWHLSTAAGATVSALAVTLFFLSHLASAIRHRHARPAGFRPATTD